MLTDIQLPLPIWKPAQTLPAWPASQPGGLAALWKEALGCAERPHVDKMVLIVSLFMIFNSTIMHGAQLLNVLGHSESRRRQDFVHNYPHVLSYNQGTNQVL